MEDAILGQDLQVIFNLIEYNIVILGSKGNNYFDPTKGEVIKGYYNSEFDIASWNTINKGFDILQGKRNTTLFGCL